MQGPDLFEESFRDYPLGRDLVAVSGMFTTWVVLALVVWGDPWSVAIMWGVGLTLSELALIEGYAQWKGETYFRYFFDGDRLE